MPAVDLAGTAGDHGGSNTPVDVVDNAATDSISMALKHARPRGLHKDIDSRTGSLHDSKSITRSGM